jgi:hypothetical protein
VISFFARIVSDRLRIHGTISAVIKSGKQNSALSEIVKVNSFSGSQKNGKRGSVPQMVPFIIKKSRKNEAKKIL